MKRKILGIALAMTFALTACGTEQDVDSSTPNSSVESMSSSVEETEKKLLTMEELIELCNDAKWKDQVEEKGIEFFLQYSNLEQDPEKILLHGFIYAIWTITEKSMSYRFIIIQKERRKAKGILQMKLMSFC